MTSWTQELDEASELATRSGSWHVVLLYFLCALATIPTSFLVFSQVFINATPQHWCAPIPELEGLELPDELVRNLTVPRREGGFESCQAYGINLTLLYDKLGDYIEERSILVREGHTLRVVSAPQLVRAAGEEGRAEQISRVTDAILLARTKEPSPCTNGWQFSTEYYKRTLTTEYALVCDDDWLPRTANTLFWTGSIFGNLIFGWFSDRYGRRSAILLMIFLEVPLTIATSFPNNYWTYIALRTIGGLFFPAMYQQPFILALELMPPRSRTYTGIVLGMLFASGICILALIAYAVKDWFYLSLATTLPFIALVSCYWLIPESPRWLVSRGKIAEAEKVLRNFGRKNGIKLPRGFLLDLHRKIKQENAEAEMLVQKNVNGNLIGFRDHSEKIEYLDRRISNMLTFKPDFIKISEINDSTKGDNIEKILALEVAEIVTKRARLKKERESMSDNDLLDNNDATEESHLDSDSKQIQIDSCNNSPASNLRRKSFQIVTRIFMKEDPEEDIMGDKKMDDENSEGDCKASPLDLFRYPNIRKKFFIMTFNWTALGIVYNSFSYNTPNLGVDDYLAFFIGGVAELPSYIIAWQCMDRYGRRWVLCIFANIGGLACLSCVFVPETWPWITVSLSMFGRLFLAASFAVFYVQVGELLPTVIRAQAMGAASFITGLGLLACPYVVYLGTYWRALPLIIMGILGILAGITTLFLPETLNQPLPQTLGDGEMLGRNHEVFSCVKRQRKESFRDID